MPHASHSAFMSLAMCHDCLSDVRILMAHCRYAACILLTGAIPGSHKAMYECPLTIKRLESATDDANRAVRHVPVKAGDMFVFTGAIGHSPSLPASSPALAPFILSSLPLSSSLPVACLTFLNAFLCCYLPCSAAGLL